MEPQIVNLATVSAFPVDIKMSNYVLEHYPAPYFCRVNQKKKSQIASLIDRNLKLMYSTRQLKIESKLSQKQHQQSQVGSIKASQTNTARKQLFSQKSPSPIKGNKIPNKRNETQRSSVSKKELMAIVSAIPSIRKNVQMSEKKPTNNSRRNSARNRHSSKGKSSGSSKSRRQSSKSSQSKMAKQKKGY